MSDLKHAAQTFIGTLARLEVPQGNTRKQLLKEHSKLPPLLAVIRFIDEAHTAEDDRISEALLKRMNVNNGLPAGLTDIAVGNEEELAQLTARLRAALEYQHKNIFDLMEKTLNDIVAERKTLLTDDPVGSPTGDNQPDAFDSALPPKDKVKLTPDEQRISDEADEFKKSQRGMADTNYIARTAIEGYGKKYEDQPPELSSYQKRERGQEHVRSHQREGDVREAEEYLELIRQIHVAYNEVLVKVLQKYELSSSKTL